MFDVVFWKEARLELLVIIIVYLGHQGASFLHRQALFDLQPQKVVRNLALGFLWCWLSEIARLMMLMVLAWKSGSSIDVKRVALFLEAVLVETHGVNVRNLFLTKW